MTATKTLSYEDILCLSQKAGYDLSGVVLRLKNGGETPSDHAEHSHAVVIVGAGANAGPGGCQ